MYDRNFRASLMTAGIQEKDPDTIPASSKCVSEGDAGPGRTSVCRIPLYNMNILIGYHLVLERGYLAFAGGSLQPRTKREAIQQVRWNIENDHYSSIRRASFRLQLSPKTGHSIFPKGFLFLHSCFHILNS